MVNLRAYPISAASGLACVRLVSILALQSAMLTLCAQSPVIYSFTGSNKLVPGSSWTETVLHNFAGTTADGAEPDGDLVLSGSTLYGTTAIGGASNDGTVFQEAYSSGTWTESVLYNFTGSGGDGNGPFAGVIINSGVLYGTTFYGGTSSNGTVYSLTPPGTGWTETVLYKFGGPPDGANPHAALVFAGSGVYYGTTYYGGTTNLTNCTSGCGTVYQLTYSSGTWSEKVLYSFSGGSDGANPHSALIIDSSGALYGTTVLGGANGKGTVYKLTPGSGGSWSESVLYSFGASSSDGSIPRAGVVFGSSQSVLYGATTSGGGSRNCTGGCGTVYKLSSGSPWTESILYSFTGTSGDGVDPYSDVIYSGGWIYGTTYNGGTSTNCTGGCGTVYALKP